MCASKTTLPVLGVPIVSTTSEPHAVKGLDSLLSIVQMPPGIPVGTLAIGKSGAINAGLLAAMILGLSDPKIAKAVADYRHAQTARVLRERDPRKSASKVALPRRRQPK
jgi:5-(carboxyamino)imidazole ribonucleotide mutase